MVLHILCCKSNCCMMETEDQECFFQLDQLPELIIDKIAWYLSNKDLAACCAVSRGVREAFDIECVWRPRYDADRVEYLLRTPCKVHPVFESPENTNNDLSPISRFRLAFMAENHLWNNWRQGKFTKEDLETLYLKSHGHEFGTPMYDKFITDDYLASIFINRIDISDVRYSPASQAFKPIPIPMDSYIRVAKDNIIVLYHSSVQVFHLDASTNQWLLKHSFFIDEAEILVDNRLLEKVQYLYDNRPDYMYTLLDQFIVGVAEGGGTMHIWNYETGVKIKTESCPVENAIIHEMLATTSKDLILSVEQGENYDSLLLAYNLSQLKFLAFQQLVQGKCISSYNYIIISNFILVWYDSKLNIYDYQNCQIKLVDHPIDYNSRVEALGNNVVFLEGSHLKLFNPWTSKMESLEDRIKRFTVLCNRFVIIERCPEEITYELLEFSDNCSKISKKITSLNYLIDYESNGISEFYIQVNKHSARAITEFFILNFW